MLFHVEMIVNIPPDMDVVRLEQLKAAEKAICQDLQAKGVMAEYLATEHTLVLVRIRDDEGREGLGEVAITPHYGFPMKSTKRRRRASPEAIAS